MPYHSAICIVGELSKYSVSKTHSSHSLPYANRSHLSIRTLKEANLLNIVLYMTYLGSDYHQEMDSESDN